MKAKLLLKDKNNKLRNIPKNQSLFTQEKRNKYKVLKFDWKTIMLLTTHCLPICDF